MDANAINARLGLAKQALQAFSFLAAGSKKWGKVLLAIDAAVGISEAIINSQVAATRALAELGPIAGPPVAGKMLAFGKVSAGIIAASSALRLGGAGGAGSSSVPTGSGFRPDPITPAPDGVILEQTTQPSNVISIDFSGGITDTQAVRDFIETDFAEALRDGSGLDVQVVAR